MDKPIMGSLEDLDEDYGPTYTGALAIPKMESHIQIHAFISFTPQRKDFLIMLL